MVFDRPEVIALSWLYQIFYQRTVMLTEYINAAMRHATYERLAGTDGYVGEIPGFQGLWANAPTEEACIQELRSALEDWLLVGLRLNHQLPEVDGISLNLDLTSEAAA